MNRRLVPSTLAGVLLGGLALAGCGSDADAGSDSTGTEAGSGAGTITVTHAQGEAEVPVDPQRVVVFDMGVLDTIDALGGTVTGVPQEFVPGVLSEYQGDGYTDVGTLFEPDYEAVDAAEPDLIIIGGRSAEAYDDLTEIATTIDLSLDFTDVYGSFQEQTETLGRVFDREAEAQEALEAIEAKVTETREAAQDAGTGLVVLTTGGKVSAYGPGSRFGGVIHDLLGVEPADTDITADTHGEAVTFEYVAETDPDWLFVLDRDTAIGESEGGAAEEVLDNQLVGTTTAWQEDQVVYLDPERWYLLGSGLSTFDAMVSQIQEELS